MYWASTSNRSDSSYLVCEAYMTPSADLSLVIYTLFLRSSNPFKNGPYSKRMDIVSDTFAVERDTFSSQDNYIWPLSCVSFEIKRSHNYSPKN